MAHAVFLHTSDTSCSSPLTPPRVARCRQVTLDQYASTIFGRSAAKQDAWICAEHDLKDAQVRGDVDDRAQGSARLVPLRGCGGATQASPAPEGRPGVPKLRPASANPPLGPYWPATSGLFSRHRRGARSASWSCTRVSLSGRASWTRGRHRWAAGRGPPCSWCWR